VSLVTWAKYDTGFFAQCADAGLSDAATLTHAQAIHWLYQCDRENVMDMSIPAKAIRRFATTDNPEPAVAQLLHVGFWAEQGEIGYVLVHHAEVVRSSLTFQRKKKESDRKAQAAARRRAAERKPVSGDVIDDVSADAYIHAEHSFIDVGSDINAPQNGEHWPPPAPVGAGVPDAVRADHDEVRDAGKTDTPSAPPDYGFLSQIAAEKAATGDA
jgi:hypothetical protein